MLYEWANQLGGESWGWLWYVLFKLAVVLAVFMPAVSLIAMFSIWWERKVAGHIQARLGPMNVGGWHGWAQSIADGLKLVMKEDLMPTGSDHFLFRLAPYLAMAPVFAAFVALPYGPNLVFEPSLSVGVLYLLAVLAVEVMGVILAGWASNSKWSVFGAMREACQMVSYEVPLGLAIITALFVAGTLNLVELSYLQGGGWQDWFIFHNPFIFAGGLIYFIASLASAKRAPFDLPESESELVAGFHTEYSGLRFSFFFFAEYAGMFIIGGVMATLFLGGWNSPLGPVDPIYLLTGYDPVAAGNFYLLSATGPGVLPNLTQMAGALNISPIAMAVVSLYGVAWFVFKVFAIIFVQMWLRWTLPRIRIDQVLYACVKVLLPAALVTMVGSAFWIWLVPQPDAVGGLMRLGHLGSDTPVLQFVTQIILAMIGAAIVAAMLGVVVWAWLHRRKAPQRTMLGDLMPVSRDRHFTSHYGPSQG